MVFAFLLTAGGGFLQAQQHAGPQTFYYNICTGDTARLGVPPVAGAVHVWPEIQPLLEFYGDTVSAYMENPGPDAITFQNFLVRFYPEDNSILIDTVIIRVLPPIQAVLPELGYSLCVGDTLRIFYPPVPYGYMYMEPDSSSFPDTVSGNPQIVAFPTQNTTYDLYVANQGGCRLGPFPLQINMSSVLDSVRFNVPDTLCFNSDPIMLDIYPETATITGPGYIGDGGFYAQLSGPGVHTLEYSQGTGSCVINLERQVVVLAQSDVSFAEIPNPCQNEPRINLSGGVPTGGVYFVGGAVNPGFDPGLFPPGPVEVTYNFIGADECRIQVTQTVFVKSIPPKSDILFVGDSTACEGDTLTLRAGADALQYLWNTGETTREIRAFNNVPYYVTVVASNGCRNTSDTLILGFNPEPEFSLSSPEFPNGFNVSSYSAADGSVALEVLAGVEPLSFNWSNGDTTQNLSGIPAGTYVVVVSDEGGCATTDTIVLTRPDTIIVPPTPPVTGLLLPNSFTPNGDGYNDAYVIRGMDPDYLQNELLVFDIRRQLVFSAKNYSNTWTGLSNSGERLAAGNYFVVFLSPALSKPITVTVYLKYE